jgi:Protein of unknown function (DUF3768)
MTDTIFRKFGEAQSDAIRELNDAFRRSFEGGAVMLTSSVIALCRAEQESILAKVKAFDDFKSENDPYGEHDFGSFEHGGQWFMFKIDYYDTDLVMASEDPTDPSITKRVLTVMLASDY